MENEEAEVVETEEGADVATEEHGDAVVDDHGADDAYDGVETGLEVAIGTDHSAAGDHGADAVGLPQLDFSTFENQIFWLLIALVAIFMILNRIALPRIGAVLAERQGTITNDIATAEDLKRQAAEAEAAYNQALADARSEAQSIAEAARAEIQGELNEAIAVADARIAEQTAESEKRISEIRDGAAASVEEVARDTAAELVRTLGLSGEVDEAAIASAVGARTGGAA